MTFPPIETHHFTRANHPHPPAPAVKQYWHNRHERHRFGYTAQHNGTGEGGLLTLHISILHHVCHLIWGDRSLARVRYTECETCERAASVFYLFMFDSGRTALPRLPCCCIRQTEGCGLSPWEQEMPARAEVSNSVGGSHPGPGKPILPMSSVDSSANLGVHSLNQGLSLFLPRHLCG